MITGQRFVADELRIINLKVYLTWRMHPEDRQVNDFQ